MSLLKVMKQGDNARIVADNGSHRPSVIRRYNLSEFRFQPLACPNIIKRKLWLVFTMSLTLGLTTPTLSGADKVTDKASRILIISTSNDTPYQEVTDGFKTYNGWATKIDFVEESLSEAQLAANKGLDNIRPDLIFALGAEALLWASAQTKKTPIVSTLVLKGETFKQASNTTGISLNYSFNTQFEWLKKFFPDLAAVAILYNPEENEQTIKTAKDVSARYGLTLRPIQVKSPKELPYALEQLSTNVEILLAIPDDTVMSVNSAKEVLLASFRNKVPLIGLSDNWVKSGAYYALSWDYVDLGKQSAEMSKKILGGTPVALVSPEQPRKVTYTINAKIVEHMNMEVPEAILDNAKKIFN